MSEYITAKEAMELLNELIDSGKLVTQDAVEEIISKLAVVDSKVAEDATTMLYTGDISAPSNLDEFLYLMKQHQLWIMSLKVLSRTILKKSVKVEQC